MYNCTYVCTYKSVTLRALNRNTCITTKHAQHVYSHVKYK